MRSTAITYRGISTFTPGLGDGLKFRRVTCHAGKAFPPPMLAAAMGETLAKLCQFPDGLPGAPRPHLPKHSHLRKRPASGSKKNSDKSIEVIEVITLVLAKL